MNLVWYFPWFFVKAAIVHKKFASDAIYDRQKTDLKRWYESLDSEKNLGGMTPILAGMQLPVSSDFFDDDQF